MANLILRPARSRRYFTFSTGAGAFAICWGQVTTGASGYVTVTFPQPFLDSNIAILATAGNAGVAGGFAQANPTATQAILQFNEATAPQPMYWTAVGHWE